MFLKQAVYNDGFPFEIKRKNPFPQYTEEEFLAKLDKSRQTMDVCSMVAEIKEKHGL